MPEKTLANEVKPPSGTVGPRTGLAGELDVGVIIGVPDDEDEVSDPQSFDPVSS